MVSRMLNLCPETGEVVSRLLLFTKEEDRPFSRYPDREPSNQLISVGKSAIQNSASEIPTT